MIEITDLKVKLYQLCVESVANRMNEAQRAINEAQSASNEDTKSSAGDKYETGREMIQQETNRNLVQLNEANKLKIALSAIPQGNISDRVENGSVVLTSNGNFYIAVSAGILTVSNENYFAISLVSPIGLKLKGLKAGDSFNLNEKNYLINRVF